MNLLPDWNKPGSFSAGRDPLGLQAASVRLYTELLPGLTNVTNRLRYFSFYCWVVRQFELKRHSTDEGKWSLFIRRAEAIYALACQIGDSAKAFGMAGSIWAARNTGIGAAFDFKPWTDGPGQDDQYLKARWGNFGQFYIASMQEMDMLERDTGRVQAVTESYGLELANAFERACPTACPLILDSIETGIIGRPECETVSDEANPGHLDQASEEAKLLTSYLCGDRVGDPTAPARRATLWNVLSIIDQTALADADTIRGDLYVQDRTNGAMAVDLQTNLEGWRAYLINELCHIALELLLNAITHQISSGGPATANVLADGIMSRGLASVESLTLAALGDRLMLGSLELEHDVGIELASLTEEGASPDEQQILSAIKLLLSLWRRWRGDAAIARRLTGATVGGRSALGIFHFLEDNADQPAAEALSAMIRKFVLSNHLLIAGHKLASAGTYTYRFIVDEGMLSDGVPAEYGFTNPRISNLITFANDAGLLAGTKLTARGKAFLHAV